MIAVDGTVYAQLPLHAGLPRGRPRATTAPPTRPTLIGADGGFSGRCSASTEALEAGESVRGGADNDEILTDLHRHLPGDAVETVIPSVVGRRFDASTTITDDGELRQAELTGVFYPDADEMTYTVDLADYGTEKDITAP